MSKIISCTAEMARYSMVVQMKYNLSILSLSVVYWKKLPLISLDGVNGKNNIQNNPHNQNLFAIRLVNITPGVV